MRRLRRAYQRNARQEAKRRKKFKQRAIAAGTAAAITLGAGVSLTKALAHTPDIHELPVSQDADADLLADTEEVALGYCPFNPDQNHNEISDGVELAKHCAEIVNQLPWEHEVTEPNQTYKWVVPVYGVEACDICGQMIHMGDGGIVNPRLGLSVDCHPISIHYMEHGSFSYAGEVHNGRMDIPKLMQVLGVSYLPYETNDHQLPVEPDADDDLISDNEEVALGYCPVNPDQNRNQIPDGVDLAKRCAADINELPWSNEASPGETYKWCLFEDGLEICDICGETVDMGPAGVVNPKLGLSVDCPLIAIHYMSHGSFSHAGHYSGEPLHVGRINVPALLRALELSLPFEPNEHQMPVPQDPDADLLANREELAIGYRPFKPDQNRNQTPDGVELAERCAAVIDQLPQIGPEDTPPDETYKVEHLARGNENCCICGVPINMGTMEIISPPLGLRVEFPILSLHYMGHGSFSYDGTTNTGRTDVPLLMRTLELRFPYDPNAHQSPVDASDLDGDFLADSEELAAGYNLYDPDQDNDLTPDGIELAKQCKVAIDQLPTSVPSDPNKPYKLRFEADGYESCAICGFTICMDHWDIVNPRLGLTIHVPVMAAHYMKHGSFGLQGGGRIDVPLLVKILEMPRRCGDLGTVYLPADLNEDCRVNFTDFIELADKWLESTDPDRDGHTER